MPLKMPFWSRLLAKKADSIEAIEKDAPTPWQAVVDSMKPKQKTIDQIAHDIETVRIPQLRHVCRKTPSIVNAMAVLKETVFKNRFEWIPNFKSRCPVCGTEFDKLVDTCPKCGVAAVEPDVNQKNHADEFFKNVNEFNQSLIEVLGIAEDEINMVDHAFLWFEREYKFIPSLLHPGNYDLSSAKLVAIEEVPPEYVTHNLKKETHRHKDEYFCYRHREVVHELPGHCPECRCELARAWYKYKDESKTVYYARDEIIDWTFYDARSHPPIYSILKKVLVEWGMDNELYERFWNKQLPKDIIAVTTSNLSSLDKTKTEIIRQAKNHEIPFVGIQSETGRGTIQKIPLLDDSIADLTNISTRDQIKKDINTVYGVVPLYAADVEHASALSGEGQQLLVQEDRAKAKQATYNEMILPNIMRAMGITDWLLQLKPPTEESELRKLQVKAQEIQNANMMLQMGFDVDLDDDGNFTFSGEASRPDITAPSPFASSISKGRTYIENPKDAPEGANVQQGERGGYYYESEGEKEEEEEEERERVVREIPIAKNTKEANEISKKYIKGLKNVDWEGVDISIANTFNSQVSKLQQQYHIDIKYMGSTQTHAKLNYEERVKRSVENLTEMGIGREIAEATVSRKLKPPAPAARSLWASSIATGEYAGIGWNKEYKDMTKLKKFMKSMDANVKSGFHPQGCNTLESAVTHEIGHQLIANLEHGKDKKGSSKEYVKALQDLHDIHESADYEERKTISAYATKNFDEFIGEAFASYQHSDNPSDLAMKVGKCLDEVFK